MIHRLHPSLLSVEVAVHLAGVGGNGSLMLSGLARLDRALRGLGHPGFAVSAWDPDHVTESNVGRQLFYPADIGQNKAVILVHRINQCFGLDWQAHPAHYAENAPAPLLITCVDSAAARVAIGRTWERRIDHRYWLDMGNRAADGQVILGARIENTLAHNLPTILDLYPALAAGQMPDDDAPSCSLAEALERQQLFINQAVTTEALELLWKLFRFGEIDHHGVFVNLNPRSVQPLGIGAETWSRFGYSPTPRTAKAGRPRKTRKEK